MNPFAFIGTIFTTFFFTPIVNLLAFVLYVLTLFHVPGALGIAIVFLTVVIRLLIWPFMKTQMKSARKMSELKPHIDRLKQKHEKDKQAFAAAQMALYKEHGINPAAGCLPSLIQLPIIIALYQTILTLFNPKAGLAHINTLLYPFIPHLTKMPDSHFFGLNLADVPSKLPHYGGYLLLVPVITAFLQFLQSKMMAPKPIKEYPSDSSKEKKEKEQTDDAMSAMQSQMMYMMPLMIGYFSWTFPIGVAIYWNTFTIFGILQQYQVSGFGGLEDWISPKRTGLKK